MKLIKPNSLHALQKHRKALRDVNKEKMQHATRLDHLALWVTNHVGTVEFFLLVFLWTAIWLIWNSVAPKNMQFDSIGSGFVLWLFISNVIQLFLMPLILVGQNIQSRHAELVAESDLEINIKAEKEIEIVLHHIEHLDKMLVIALEKLGVNMHDVLEQVEHEEQAHN